MQPRKQVLCHEVQQSGSVDPKRPPNLQLCLLLERGIQRSCLLRLETFTKCGCKSRSPFSLCQLDVVPSAPVKTGGMKVACTLQHKDVGPDCLPQGSGEDPKQVTL